MTYNLPNRITLIFLSVLLLTSCIISIYLNQPYLSFASIGLVVLLFCLQRPAYLFYVLVATIPWSIEYNFSQSLSTDLPDEPLMLITAFTAIALFISNKTKRSFKLHPLLFLVFLQVVWLILSVLLSTDFLVSLKYFLAKSWYLLAFIIAPLFILNKKTLIRSAIVLLVSMAAVMCIVITRHAQNEFLFSAINESVKPFFKNHVIYSALLVCMVPVEIAILQLAVSRPLKKIIPFLLFITIVAIYFTYSRGAWLALFIGLFTYLIIKKRLLEFSFLTFIFLTIGATYWLKNNDRYLRYAHDYKTTIFHKDFSEHLVATYKLKDVSTAERFYRWIAGLRMIKDHWWEGVGPNTFYENYKPYAIPAFRTWVSENKEHSTVHNYFLLLAIEQGVPSMILFILLFILSFWHAQKIYTRSRDKFWKVTAAAIASILMMLFTLNFLSDLIEVDKTGCIFYLCIAILIIADKNTRINDFSTLNSSTNI